MYKLQTARTVVKLTLETDMSTEEIMHKIEAHNRVGGYGDILGHISEAIITETKVTRIRKMPAIISEYRDGMMVRKQDERYEYAGF